MSHTRGDLVTRECTYPGALQAIPRCACRVHDCPFREPSASCTTQGYTRFLSSLYAACVHQRILKQGVTLAMPKCDERRGWPWKCDRDLFMFWGRPL